MVDTEEDFYVKIALKCQNRFDVLIMCRCCIRNWWINYSRCILKKISILNNPFNVKFSLNLIEWAHFWSDYIIIAKAFNDVWTAQTTHIRENSGNHTTIFYEFKRVSDTINWGTIRVNVYDIKESTLIALCFICRIISQFSIYKVLHTWIHHFWNIN